MEYIHISKNKLPHALIMSQSSPCDGKYRRNNLFDGISMFDLSSSFLQTIPPKHTAQFHFIHSLEKLVIQLLFVKKKKHAKKQISSSDTAELLRKSNRKLKQRPKNLGGRVALPYGKFLRVTPDIAMGSFRTLWIFSG